MKKLLLLGDTSVPWALGSKLLRGANSLELEKTWNLDVAYNSPAIQHSPSMQKLRWKIFYRLCDRRSMEWWRFQEELTNTIKNTSPDLVVVTGILPLKQKVFELMKKKKCKSVNYLTDDPWNSIHKRSLFTRNIQYYDHIFSTKKKLIARLKSNGAREVSWLPFAYDPELHYPVEVAASSEIIFVGTGANERRRWLEALGDYPHMKKKLYGNNWEQVSVRGWEKNPAVTGNEYCKTISAAQVVLGLLRAQNGDLSTDRSYEIGAIGGCGIYEDTEEHRLLLPNYPNIGFFKNPSELKSNVEVIINNPELRRTLREIGLNDVSKEANTYKSRLATIIAWADQ